MAHERRFPEVHPLLVTADVDAGKSAGREQAIRPADAALKLERPMMLNSVALPDVPGRCIRDVAQSAARSTVVAAVRMTLQVSAPRPEELLQESLVPLRQVQQALPLRLQALRLRAFQSSLGLRLAQEQQVPL
jgi:hypothetical protein